jgi:ubiquinone biosynthesis accessory factor UbiJ
LFEAGFNRVLQLDPDALRRFSELHGKVILLEIALSGAPLRIYLLPSHDAVGLRREYAGLPDVTISGPPSVFLNALVGGPAVSAALTIRGDIELGQRFQRIVSHLAPDWEEGLAHVVGDIPAHQFARLARGFVEWNRQTLRTLGVNGAEYLQEEAFVLAKRERVQELLREVDRLRADADRLEKRIERLTDTR